MSAVKVWHEPGDAHVVVCFDAVCPEHEYAPPWVSEHETDEEAQEAARQHRAEIKGRPRCETCGRPQPAPTDAAP